jgi:hypothetical protein
VGAREAATESDDVPALSAEYHLPLDNRRIDVLFFGHDEAARAHAVELELKQWSTFGVEDEHALNVLVDGQEQVHPSQQALDYAGWLADDHSAFTAGGVRAFSAARVPQHGAVGLGADARRRVLGPAGQEPALRRRRGGRPGGVPRPARGRGRRHGRGPRPAPE